MQSCNVEQFRTYLNVLSRLSPSFSKAGVTKMEIDGSDTDSDSETDEAAQPVISRMEAEVCAALTRKYSPNG